MRSCPQQSHHELRTPSKNWMSPTKYQKQTQQKPYYSFTVPADPKQTSDKNQETKFCMAELCRSFLQKHSHRTQHSFNTSELISDFNVKQRRVYDLMNILEGCGCVKRIAKGRYDWLGIQGTSFLKPQDQKGDPTSLRQISARLKLILYESQNPLTFTDLNNNLLLKNDKIINPASIRRRIYQCCKVFILLGYIDKIGKQYIWSQKKQKNNIVLIDNSKQIKKIKLDTIENKIINDILKKIKKRNDLDNFIQKLKESFINYYGS